MASLVLQGDVALQKMTEELMSGGKRGKAIFRKGVRAGAKIIAKTVKSGKAAASVKVRAIRRSRARVGVRVSLFAASPAGFPYPMGLERGTKQQKKGGRIRKERNAEKYNALTWHVSPQHNVENAFAESGDQAMKAVETTWARELEKQGIK